MAIWDLINKKVEDTLNSQDNWIDPESKLGKLMTSASSARAEIKQKISEPIWNIISSSSKAGPRSIGMLADLPDILSGYGIESLRGGESAIQQGKTKLPTESSEQFLARQPRATTIANKYVEQKALQAGLPKPLAAGLGTGAGLAVGLIEPFPVPGGKWLDEVSDLEKMVLKNKASGEEFKILEVGRNDVKLQNVKTGEIIPTVRKAIEAEGKFAPFEIKDDSVKGILRPKEQVAQEGPQQGTLEVGMQQSPSQVLESPQVLNEKFSSSLNDMTELDKGQLVNVDNLKISDDAKKLIEKEIEGVRADIEKKVGEKLSNKEIIQATVNAGEKMKTAIGREQTMEWETSMLKLRQEIAKQASSGTVNKEFLDNLVVWKTRGADIGRKLQSMSIGADPKEASLMEKMISEVTKFSDNADEILKAAQGVDFNNLKEATKFYRKFVKPKMSEWVDLVRYNSMLSSPLTHIVNTVSNTFNSTLLPILQKTSQAGLDLLSSTFTGKARKYFSGEALAYIKAYANGLQSASKRFASVIKGTREFTNLDYRNIPLTTGGAANKIEKILSVPTKFLEGSDQFFMDLVTNAEKASLEYRVGKGVDVNNIEAKSQQMADYLLYRQELKAKGQGNLLNAMDTLTGTVERLRTNENPWVALPAKFTFPFIKTPTNIFKQGIEYSPLGWATLPGAANKFEQLTKAMIGTSIASAAGLLIASDRMTWAEPAGSQAKNDFRASGKVPYGIKFGDKWYSYQKLPPFISFPLSMVALVHDSIKNKKIDDSLGNLIFASFAKEAQFMANQSYFKTMGDLWDAINGDEFAIEKLVGNYPQQMVPFRALSGWFARMIDEYQRTLTPKADFFDKQIELLMMNIPGLSQELPAKKTSYGTKVKNQFPVVNSLSPVRVGQEKKSGFLSNTTLPKLPKLPKLNKMNLELPKLNVKLPNLNK